MKQIPDFPNYSVTEDGKVWSHINNRFLKGGVDNQGYLQISLYPGKKRFRVHRLVAQAFIPNHNNKPHINHIDGNKLNNCTTNLEWCTPSDNTIHAYSNNLINKKGENHHLNKLCDSDVKEIKKLLETTSMHHIDIANRFNVHQSTIGKIKRGKSWSHI